MDNILLRTTATHPYDEINIRKNGNNGLFFVMRYAQILTDKNLV